MAFGANIFLSAYITDREGPYRVWVSRLTSGGELLDPVGIPVVDPRGPWGAAESGPAVAFDGTDFLVVWAQDYGRLDPRTGRRPFPGVFGARVAPDGSIRPPGAFAVGSNDADSGGADAVTVASNGAGWLVAWTSGDRVRARRLAPNGAPLDQPPLDLGAVSRSSVDLTVIPDQRGYVVHWREACTPWECEDPIRAARVPEAGAAVAIEPLATIGLPVGFDGDAFVAAWPGRGDDRDSAWVTFRDREGRTRAQEDLRIPIGRLLGVAVSAGRTTLVGELGVNRFALARIDAATPRTVQVIEPVPVRDDVWSCRIASGDGADLIVLEDSEALSYQRVSADGVPEPVAQEFGGTESQTWPVAAAGVGGAMVAWFGAAGREGRVRGVRVDASGVPVGPPRDLLPAFSVDDRFAPSVARLVEGWRLLRPFGNGLETLRLDSNGEPVGQGTPLCGDFDVLDMELGCQGDVCLGLWAKQTYTTNDDGILEESDSEVYAAYVDASGLAGAPIRLTRTYGLPAHLRVVADEEGFFATWENGLVEGARLPLIPHPAGQPTGIVELQRGGVGITTAHHGTACIQGVCLLAGRRQADQDPPEVTGALVDSDGRSGPVLTLYAPVEGEDIVDRSRLYHPGATLTIAVDGPDFIAVFAIDRPCGTDIFSVRVALDGTVSPPVRLRSGLRHAGFPSLVFTSPTQAVLTYEVFDPRPTRGNFRVVTHALDRANL